MIGTAPPTAGYVRSPLVGRTPQRTMGPALRPGQLAKRWSVGRNTVTRMCTEGKLPGAWQTPTGKWRIPLATIVAHEERERERDKARVIRRPPPIR